MNTEERKKAFIQLGKVLSHFTHNQVWIDLNCGLTKTEFEDFNELIVGVKKHNGWFTEENVRQAIGGIVSMLKSLELESWLTAYSNFEGQGKKVGVIMAGNIPMVGFHDMLCVLMSGHRVMAKLSSEDSLLLPAIAKMLIDIEPRFESNIRFVQRLKEMDAVIATGSDNSARYFENYFGEYPNIIRKNRTSVGFITGNEKEEELSALADDIFLYFGKGCRNVTHLLIPKGYDLNNLFKAFYRYKDVIHHHKYANNYDYNKAIYLMNKTELIENGFLMLKEDESLHSPLSMLNYSYYSNLEEVNEYLSNNAEKIQCVIGQDYIPFGKAQTPSIRDYADGVDTMEFLLSL